MMATIPMMALFKLSKKSCRTFPCCFMFLMTRPKPTEKTTNPRTFTPAEEPGSGTSSSCGTKTHFRQQRFVLKAF